MTSVAIFCGFQQVKHNIDFSQLAIKEGGEMGTPSYVHNVSEKDSVIKGAVWPSRKQSAKTAYSVELTVRFCKLNDYTCKLLKKSFQDCANFLKVLHNSFTNGFH